MCGKVKQKKRNKSPCAYFFFIPLKKNIFLSFFSRVCGVQITTEGRGAVKAGRERCPAPRGTRRGQKKRSGHPKSAAARDGPKRKSKLMRVTISKILVLTRLHFAGLRLIFRVNLICCSGCASGLMVLMRHSIRSVHPMSSKSAVSLLSLLGR